MVRQSQINIIRGGGGAHIRTAQKTIMHACSTCMHNCFLGSAYDFSLVL